jgi:large subunit ribosomal protein L6
MSRVGRMPIAVPSGVAVDIKGSEVTVSGPKGKLSRSFNREMMIALEGSQITVSRGSDETMQRAQHGLTRTLLANMVNGVTKGFTKNLEIVGVGFRVEKKGNNLVLRLGFSHPVEVVPLPGVSLSVEGVNRMIVSGIDKEVVGQMAAKIRAFRPPDAYKGKGIRYAGETVRLKPGKSKQTAKK